MNNIWNRYDTLLELVEALAEHEGAIASEDELSEKFDNEIMPHILEQYGKPGIEFEDTDLVIQAFNDWTDGLCKDGEIHQAQYDNYEYVGEWS
jgi:hypothetical protein